MLQHKYPRRSKKDKIVYFQFYLSTINSIAIKNNLAHTTISDSNQIKLIKINNNLINSQSMYEGAAIMSNKYQLLILRKLVVFMYFFIQLFGLWPYNIDNITHHIQYNLFKLIYSIVLPVIVLYAYLILGMLVLAKSFSKAYVQSQTLEAITAIYTLIIISSYISLYVGQHLTFNKRKSIYSKCIEVIELLQTIPNESVDLRKYLAYFFLKTILFEIFNFIIMFINLKRSSNFLATNPLLPLFMSLPVWAIRLNENIFFGGILLINVIFKQFNNSLANIVKSKNKTSEFHRKNNRHFIEQYCHLSDELDKLSKFHFKLNEATKAFNSFFYLQLLLWIISQFAVLITRFFILYIGFVQLFDKHEDYKIVVIQNLVLLGITMVAWLEIFLTSYACESLLTEVK